MAIEKEIIENSLTKSFPDAIIKLEDLFGDQDHYSLEIISAEFCDKSLIQQHRMVNEALKSCLGTDLHALKIKTACPVK